MDKEEILQKLKELDKKLSPQKRLELLRELSAFTIELNKSIEDFLKEKS